MLLRLVAVVALVSALAGTASAINMHIEPDSTLLDPRKGVQVDTSKTAIFEKSWRKYVVRFGLQRDVTSLFGRPAISERSQSVVVGTTEGHVVCLDLRTGATKWTFAHIAPFETGALIVDVGTPSTGHREVAILGSRDGHLYAFDLKTGEVAWQIGLDGDMRTPPRQAGREILVTTATNKVYVIDPGSGTIRWARGRPAPTGLTIHGHARALVYDGVVYATFSDGYVEAYALDDGRGMWSRPLSVRGGDFVDSDADPVMCNGRLFVASYSDGIYALDPRDGTTFWTTHRSSGHLTRGTRRYRDRGERRRLDLGPHPQRR